MTVEEKEQLATALLKCNSIKDLDSRNTLLENYLPGLWPQISHNPKSKFHVYNILGALSGKRDSEERDLLIRLRKGIYFFEEKSHAAEEVYKVISLLIYRGFLYREHLSGLYGIVGDLSIPDNKLIDLYLESLPVHITPIQETYSLYLIVEHLFQIPKQPIDNYPGLFFINKLLSIIPDSSNKKRNDLQDWIEDILNYLKLPMNYFSLEKIDKSLNRNNSLNSTPYLLVFLIPDQAGNTDVKNKFYEIEIVLWWNKDKSEYICRNENRITLSEAPIKLKETIENLAKEIPDKISEVRLEFFLPLDLLSIDVDQWIQKDDLIVEVKIGADYPVVVRSLERATRPIQQKYWHPRCEYLYANEDENLDALEDYWCLFEENNYEELELYDRLLTENNQSIFFVTLSFYPGFSRERGTILMELLRAGLPIILWPRIKPKDIAEEKKIIALIEEICNDRCLNYIPEALKQQRRKALRSGKEDFRNNMTLLWDDPKRLPKELRNHYKLTSP